MGQPLSGHIWHLVCHLPCRPVLACVLQEAHGSGQVRPETVHCGFAQPSLCFEHALLLQDGHVMAADNLFCGPIFSTAVQEVARPAARS